MTKLDTITDALKQARERLGISQQSLSNQTGIPQSHISRIERGEVDLKTSSLIELARVLELELTLIPRRQLNVVKAILRGDDNEHLPAYRLEDD